MFCGETTDGGVCRPTFAREFLFVPDQAISNSRPSSRKKLVILATLTLVMQAQDASFRNGLCISQKLFGK